MSDWYMSSVTYREYDPTYPRVFARIADLVHEALPEIRIEHVGSTSVPGLGGRPVVDIVIICSWEIWEAAHRRLLGVGFKDFPYARTRPMLTTSVHMAGNEYPVLAYVFPADHEYVRAWKAFREYMSQHPEEIRRYAQTKRAAIEAGESDPQRYRAAKTRFLEELAKRIAWSESLLTHQTV